MKPNEQADANIIVKSENSWQEQVIFYMYIILRVDEFAK